MLTKLSHVIGDVFVGLLVAGVLVGGVVPMVGGVIGPATAAGVAVVSATGALIAGHLLRRSRRGSG